MKKCYKCNVMINSSVGNCPLCNCGIEHDDIDENIFPLIRAKNEKHNLFFKILLFLSVLGCAICTVVNYIVSKEIGWAWFVIAGIVSFWVTFITGIRTRKHMMSLLFSEVMLILIASLLWDYFTGWHFWSVTYVLPFLSISYITILFFLRIFLKNIFRDYVIYIYINSLIGLTPLYFILRDLLSVRWPSIICIVFSICSILLLAVFNHRQMVNELERRFHI